MSTSKVKVKRSDSFCPRAMMKGHEKEWYSLNAGNTIIMDRKYAESLSHIIVIVGEAKADTVAKKQNDTQKVPSFLNRKKGLEGNLSDKVKE